MIENTAESGSGSWTSPESHLTIEYPRALLDEIRLTVGASFHSNLRGGAAAGGVFFGSHTDGLVRIAAWRPLPREHSLEEMLASASTDPDLQKLTPLGWFVPHGQGGLELTESDVKTFDQYFPERWQFTLVVQPALIGQTKAAFFIRNPDGGLGAHAPEREFVLEPLRAPRVHGRGPASNGLATGGATEAATEPVRVQAPPRHRNTEMVRVRPGTQPAAPALRAPVLQQPPPRSRGRWFALLWAIPLIALVVYGVIVGRERLTAEPRPATLLLRVQDWPGAQLHVDWEKESLPIQTARRGELVFEEGGKRYTVQLDAAQLRLGSFSYQRHSGNVKVKLSLFGDNNAAPSIEELAEYNGAAPRDVVNANDEREAWAKQKTELETEIKRLRGQLAAEKSHREDLQNLVRVLENRLKLAPPK